MTYSTAKKLLMVVAIFATTIQLFNLYGFDAESIRPSARYRTIKVERLTENVGLRSAVATLPDSVYRLSSPKVAKPLRITVKDNLVSNIGIDLFADSIRIDRAPIYDFIERLALECTLKPRADRLDFLDDNDIDLFGSLDMATNLAMSDSTVVFTIAQINKKGYDVTWYKGGDLVCNLKFPSSYSLILGYQTPEGDNTLSRDIKASPMMLKPAEVFTDSLLQRTDTLVYTRHGSYLRTKSISSNLYLRPDSAGKFDLICSSIYPAESFANLLVSQHIDNDIMLDIKIEKYGRATERVAVPLKQLFGFADRYNLKTFVGTRSYDKTTGDISVLVELYNPDCSYMHMLRINANQEIFDTRNGTMTASLTPFIPLQKLKLL